jgi:hypothetical protein
MMHRWPFDAGEDVAITLDAFHVFNHLVLVEGM